MSPRKTAGALPDAPATRLPKKSAPLPSERRKFRKRIYGVTFNVNDMLLVIGLVPPVVAFTTTVLAPTGVPGFLLLLPEVPPQDAIHTVENPSTTISPSTRNEVVIRLREPATHTMPNNPGMRSAYTMPLLRSKGRSSFDVGAVVVIVKLMPVTCVGLTGLNTHTDSLGSPVQL